MDNPTNIWRELLNWPPEERLALARRLLESLQRNEVLLAVSPERRNALQQLIGIWKTQEPPNDEQANRIVEQERMKKYR